MNKISYFFGNKVIEIYDGISKKKYYCFDKSKFDNIYGILDSINYQYFLKGKLYNNYYLVECYDKCNFSLLDLVNSLSCLYNSTKKSISINKEEIYNKYLKYFTDLKKYFFDIQDFIEEMDYISKDYYYLLINISKIHNVLGYALFYLEKWKRCSFDNIISVMLIGRFNNLYYSDNLYFTDFNCSCNDYFILDFIELYRQNNINIFEFIELFKNDFSFLDYDLFYFLFNICDIGFIDFSYNRLNNLCKFRNIIDYCNRTLLFLDNYKEYLQT